MATVLYLANENADVSRGQNDTNKAGAAVAWKANRLTYQLGFVPIETTVATVAGTTLGLEPGSPRLEWLSDPIDAITISGTITLNICAKESSTMANATISVIIERLDKSLTVVSTISDSTFNTELSGSMTDRQWTATPTSTNMLKGERIRVRVYFDDNATTGTMASGYTLTMAYGAAEVSTNNPANSRITFTENLVFLNTLPGHGSINKNVQTGPCSNWISVRGSTVLLGDTPSSNGLGSYRSSLSGGETSNIGLSLTSIVQFLATKDNGTHCLFTGSASSDVPRLSTATSLAGPFTSRTPAGITLGRFNGLFWDGSYWVIAGGVTATSGWILYATDPTGTWTQVSMSGVTAPFEHVCGGGGYWVVGGPNNVLWAVSGAPSGTWTSETSGLSSSAKILSITYNRGYFYLENELGETAYATDPTGTWTVGPTMMLSNPTLNNLISLNEPQVIGGRMYKMFGKHLYSKVWPWDSWLYMLTLDTSQTTFGLGSNGTDTLVMAGATDNEMHYITLATLQTLFPTDTVSDIADQGAGINELTVWTTRGSG